MGNNASSESRASTLPRRKWGVGKDKKETPPSNAESSRVLFLLYLIHRTWNIVVEHVDSKSVSRWRGSRRNLDSDSDPRDSELASQYSFCSCSHCRCAEDGDSLCSSELTYRAELQDTMAPNSSQNQRGSWADETAREKQRPPTYNPEDYAAALRKWGRRNTNTTLSTPGASPRGSQVDLAPSPTRSRHHHSSDKDYRNPCLSPGGEMSLRQFGSLSELLTKLRADLRLAFPSFVQEFISEPLDGVSLVVEALRSIQLSQSGATLPSSGPGAGSTTALTTSPPSRLPPAVQRRSLLDELACLQCLHSCCQRYPESARRLVSCPAGLYALAACIMSTVNKSRVLALQLLTTACEVSHQGHSGVSEALSTLRLRYGEPCRFRFLAGMLQSGAGGGELPAAGLRLLAAMLGGAATPQRRLYLQAELDQAGLDVVAIRKAVARNTPGAEQVLTELARYERQLIDVDGLSEKATEAEKEKDDLKTKLQLLEKRVQILQEEKGILLSLEQCLKERCCELQDEVTSLRSEHGNSGSRKKSMSAKQRTIKRDESSPPEDEGISSSERSLSPDDDLQREPMVYEVFNVKNETILMRSGKPKEKHLKTPPSEVSIKKLSDDEDETTIEEVIEELRNIINDAESEQYEKDKIAEENRSKFNKKSDVNVLVKTIDHRNHRDLEKKDSITSTKHNIIITNGSDYISRSLIDSDSEIIPVKILPQPPRKSKSLVHLFIPSAQQGVICNNKNDLSYEDDQPYYSSDEGSDSLLSASRCQPQLPIRPEKQDIYVKTNNRSLLNTIMDARERAVIAEKREHQKRVRHRSGEDICKKQSVKRTESFQKIEQQVGIVGVEDIKLSKDSFDGIFYLNETNDSPYETLTRHSENRNEQQIAAIKQREDFAALLEAKKLTKSLDRIDEGLDSMVDIILTSSNNRQYDWNGKMTKIHSNIDLARDPSGNVVVRSPSKRRVSRNSKSRHDSKGSGNKINQEIYESSHQSSDGSHRLFLPSSRMSSNSYEQQSQNNGSNNAFVLKRGHVNAGLYSGQNCNRDKIEQNGFGSPRITNVAISGKNLTRALSPPGTRSTSTTSNMNGLAKLTDIPSGLY